MICPKCGYESHWYEFIPQDECPVCGYRPRITSRQIERAAWSVAAGIIVFICLLLALVLFINP